MFGLSFTHLVLLAIIALVVLGPEQLPEVARTIARLLNEWKRATSDIQTSLTRTFNDDLNRPPPVPAQPPSPTKVETAQDIVHPETPSEGEKKS